MGNKKGNKPGRTAVGKGSHDNRLILERFHHLSCTKIPSKYRIHSYIINLESTKNASYWVKVSMKKMYFEHNSRTQSSHPYSCMHLMYFFTISHFCEIILIHRDFFKARDFSVCHDRDQLISLLLFFLTLLYFLH